MKRIITILISTFFLALSLDMSAQSVFTIGNGTLVNSPQDYPTPYGNYYFGSKEQYLIKASELQSAGATAGNISKLEFNVSGMTSVPLNGFTIKMGYYYDTTLYSNFVQNLTTVYSVGSYTDFLGWNGHSFQTPFFWDGYNNIIVEVCFNNTNYIGNAGVYSTATTFVSTLNYHNDAMGICNETSGNPFYQRPNMRLTIAPPPQNNLAIIELVNPSPNGSNTPNANQPISVKILNKGLSAQDSFALKYSVDFGNSYVNETYSGSILAGDTLDYTFTAKANMSNTNWYQVLASVNNPGDQDTSDNNFQEYVVMCNPFSGNYTLGNGSGYDFQSFQHLASMISRCGVTGPVNISVASGIYNEQVQFGQISGASETNKITISSATGNYNDVTLQWQANNSYNDFTLSLDGTDYLVIKNITIKALDGYFNTALKLENQAYKNLIYQNMIISNKNGYSNAIADNFNIDNKYIKNNITGGNNGIGIMGYDDYNTAKNIVVDSNIITGYRESGIYATYVEGLKVRANQINNQFDYNGSGITINRCRDGFEISSNKIELNSQNQLNGLLMQWNNYGFSSDTANSDCFVFNNMISLESYYGNSSGIYSYYNERTSFYNNSILMEGSSSTCRAFYQNNDIYQYSAINIGNNIFVNKAGGYTIYFDNFTSVGYCNYNNYFNANNGNFAYLGGNRSTLAELKSYGNKDLNSVSIDPVFYSKSNLHSSSILMSNKGTYIPDVLKDIDGQIRSVTTPDMGADEYTPPMNNLTLIEISSTTIDGDKMCNLDNETLIAILVNNGTNTQTSIPLRFKINNQTVVSETWTGSLASGDTLSYQFTTLGNFSQGGKVVLSVYSALANDENKLDDTVTYSFNTWKSITTLPFFDDFESPENLYFSTEDHSDSYAIIDTVHGLNSRSAIFMRGGDFYSGWQYYGSDILQQISSNSSHFAKASLCPFDATGLTNLRMTLKIDQERSSENSNFFFVKINDSIFAKTMEGDSVFIELDGETTLTFDLSPYTGSNINISLCGILRTNQDYYYGQADEITIDDFRLYVPQNNDVAVVGVNSSNQSRCGSPNDTLLIMIKNLGLLSQTNIPIVCNMTWGTTTYNFNKVYTGTLSPNQDAIVNMGIFNSQGNGFLDFVSYTNLATDQIKANDTLKMYGQMDNILSIPYVETWENGQNNWNLNDFYIQNLAYMGLGTGNVLAIEAWGQAEAPEEAPGSQINYDSYAYFEQPIGFVGNNAYLIFDYRFFNLNSFDDSINIALISNCEENQQTVYSFNKYQTYTPNMWQKVAVPLSGFNGKLVQMMIYRPNNSMSTSNFVLALDNIGIVNATPVNLGNDTAICFGDTLLVNTGLSAASGLHFQWFGPGATASDTLPNFKARYSGNYFVKVTDNFGLVSSDTINLIVRSQVTGTLSTPKPTICYGDSTQIYVNIFGAFPIIFQWTDGSITQSDTAFSYFQSKYFNPTSTTQYSLTTLTDQFGCQYSSSESVTVTVNQLLNVSTSGLDSQYCVTTSPSTLIGIPAGGIFSGNGVVGNSFNPSLANAGQHNVYYNYTDINGCAYTEQMQTVVYNNPSVGIVSNIKSQYCANDPLETFLAFPSGGTFTGSGMTGNLFNPANANIGNNSVVFSYTDQHNCTSSDTAVFVVNATPTVNITTTLLNAYCADAGPVTLTGSPTGGVFTGGGVSGSIFNPATAPIGTNHIIYSYTNASGCVSSDTVSTVVNPLPVTVFTTQFAPGYCQDGSTVNLNGYPSGGIFNGNGVTGNVFSANNANVGSNNLTYIYTDVNGCTKTDSKIVTVYATPTVNITTTLLNAYCADAGPVTLTGSPTGGVFTGGGVSGSIFNPATAPIGTNHIIYSYTNASGCVSSDTVSTVVNPLPVTVFTTQFAPGYCQDGSTVNLNGYPSGGIFNGNGVTGNVFSANNANVGSNNLTYIYTDVNGCTKTDSKIVTVFPLPNVVLYNLADVCNTVNQIALSGGLPSGGQYSGNSVNSNQGKFIPTIASIGLNEIYYSYTDVNGCSDIDSAYIRVVGQPSAAFSLPANICVHDSLTINYTGNASTLALFSWNFDNAQGVNGSGAGPYTMRWDTAGIKALSLSVTDSGCVSTMQYNYTNVMDAIANIHTIGSNSACYADSVLLFANNGPGYSYQWYDTTNLMTSSADTLPYFYGLSTGVYYAKVVNNFGCSAISNQMNISINPEITSDFSLTNIACKDDIVSINYLGTNPTTAVYNWNFNGGSIASGSGVGPYGIIWNNDGTKNVSLYVEDNGCSSLTTTKTIDIISTPATITPLGSTSFCNGGNVTLYANSGNNLTYEWFKNGVSLNDYNYYYTATQSGSYTVKVTNANLGCVNTSAPVMVTVNTTNFNLAFTANQTSFTIPPFIANITNQTVDTSSYYWNWSFGDGGVSTMANPKHQYLYDGNYTVGVIAQNINTGCFDTLIKSNYISCTGGSANPCNLVATISPTGPMTICPGDSIKLNASLNANSTYQWLKDGVLISGADTTFYWAKQLGNYQIMITDPICSKFSSPFSLSIHNTITPVIAASGTIMPCTSDSMQLYVTNSFNSYMWSNGATTSNIYVTNSGNYTVTGIDINSCKTTSAPYIVNASLLPTPSICIVGVDSATNTNFVVWERQANPLIDSFKVYRESTVAGVYNLLGSTSINDPGLFHDPNSNPMQQAYRYKITAVDSCGMETPPSDYHKTIHLSINAGLNNSWNLIWSHYVGFNFGSYRIYRGYDSTALQPLTQIQSTLNSFTDLNPPTGKVYYQIEVVAPHSCFPDSLYSKAQTNYNTSRSNNVNTTMAGGVGITEMLITDYSADVYPNPNDGSFELKIMSAKDEVYQIKVRNVLGQEIYTSEQFRAFGQEFRTIDLGKPSPGVYYLTLENNGQRLVKKLIIK
jgi:hypothetical protein